MTTGPDRSSTFQRGCLAVAELGRLSRFARMHILRITILLAALLFVIGCDRRQSATPEVTAITNENQWFRDGVAEARQLESKADAIFAVEGAGAEHSVRLRWPAPAVTNDLVGISDFQTALASVQRRELAIVEMYAQGFDTNRLTNAAARLRQCGFQDVRAVVLGWGGRFVGPAL
jgi:hypothetical protein